VQRHVVALDLVGDQLGHLGVERGEHLGRRLDDRGGDTALVQVLGDLDADEAAADHQGASR
jgi:hypothetical protein